MMVKLCLQRPVVSESITLIRFHKLNGRQQTFIISEIYRKLSSSQTTFGLTGIKDFVRQQD